VERANSSKKVRAEDFKIKYRPNFSCCRWIRPRPPPPLSISTAGMATSLSLVLVFLLAVWQLEAFPILAQYEDEASTYDRNKEISSLLVR
jgi:hypothetical protein